MFWITCPFADLPLPVQQCYPPLLMADTAFTRESITSITRCLYTFAPSVYQIQIAGRFDVWEYCTQEWYRVEHAYGTPIMLTAHAHEPESDEVDDGLTSAERLTKLQRKYTELYDQLKTQVTPEELDRLGLKPISMNRT